MPPCLAAVAQPNSLAMLFAGAVGLLASVLIGGKALLPADAPPGRRALVHALPIAAAAITFALLGHFELAIGIIFGTSVAAVSVVVGFAALAAPVQPPSDHARAMWFLWPVAATLVLLIGMHGYVRWGAALLLAGQGSILLWLWLTNRSPVRAEQLGRELQLFNWPGAPAQQTAPPRAARRVAPWIAALVTLIVAGLAAAAAWAAARGAIPLSEADPRYTLGIVSSTLLSVALALPMITTAMPQALAGRGGDAVTGQLGVAMIALCGLLPAIVGIWEAARQLAWVRNWLPGPSLAGTDLLLPRAVSRIDTVAIVLVSLVLMGVALGSVRLDRRLGSTLIFGYLAYLLHTLVSNAIHAL